MIAQDIILASSKFNRPKSKLVTYREINSSPTATPYSPSPEDFAVIDHVLIHERSFHQFKAVSSRVHWQLTDITRFHSPSPLISLLRRRVIPKTPDVKVCSVDSVYEAL